MARLAASSQPALGTIDTARGAVRYGAVPVRVAGSPDTGVFVVAVFRDLERAEINSATWTFAAVAFGTLALAAVAALLIAGRVLRPIRLVRQTAQQISATDLSQRIPVEGNDDVAELARTFNGMLDRLQTTFEAQRQFLNDASHELRTPITIVQGHLELAESDPSTRTESLAIVMDELERMRRIVEDLLMLARSDSPNFLRLSEVDLEPFIDEVLDKARALAPRKWYLDHQSRRRGLCSIVSASPRRCCSSRSTPPSTPTTDQEIHLGTEIRGDQLHLWVRDTGSGVPPADRERVFDRFARGDSTNGDSSGTGLGLAIVRAIAQAHGGTVVLVETSSGGAEFRLELPLHHQMKIWRPLRRTPCGADAVSRILIAEDEARISSFIEKGLRASGLATTVVASGVQALALARSGEFDLMILDIGLPELDGFTVLHALRSGSVDLPVLILTARDGIDDTVAGLRRWRRRLHVQAVPFR